MLRIRLFAIPALSMLVLACGLGARDEATASAASADRIADAGSSSSSGERQTLRIVAANISTGPNQSYDPGEGGRIFQALTPDVVLIQEFNYGANDRETIAGWVATTFGPEFQYTRGGGGQIPNGVISRFPIMQSGTWKDPETNTRDFTWARLDIPGDKELWAVSVHLLTANSSTRGAEAREIVARIKAEVPATDYVVIGGDFNTGSRSESAVQAFSDVTNTQGPYPVDQNGNDDTNRGRNDPYDWVLVSPQLHNLKAPVVVGGITFPNGLVFDSRVFRPIANVPPVKQNDSAGQNMQHMAVVRDFVLPN